MVQEKLKMVKESKESQNKIVDQGKKITEFEKTAKKNQTKISEQEQQITKLGLQIKEANEAKDTIRKEMDVKMKE